MRLLLSFCIVSWLFLQGGCQTTPSQSIPGQREVNRLADLHTRLGVGYMQEGRDEIALNRLQRALEADANHAPAHNAMALLHERLGEVEKSEVHYRRAVQLDPSLSAAQTNFGSFLCRQGRTEEAEARFLEAVANPLYDRPEVAYTNAGLCMRSAGDMDKAETYLRRALQANSRLAVALLEMADLSFDKGQYLQARAYLQRYLDVAQHTPRSLWLGIQVERVLGDQNAVSSYAMLLRVNYPDSQETRLLLESENR